MSASRFGHASAHARPWRAAGWYLGPAVGAIFFAATSPADAHGFGERYELPLPLSLYVSGAAAVVALSFIVFGLFVRSPHVPSVSHRTNLLACSLGRVLSGPAFIWTLKVVTLALFIVTILAGLIGAQNSYRNIAPTLVWIAFWVGLAYVSAFAGDLWALINPWRTVYDGADWLCRRLGWTGELAFNLAYPRALSAWPACILLFGFSWIELVYPSSAAPAHIACFAIAYSILTWAGMLAFGRDTWLRNGEVFSLVFGTFARFAPTEPVPGRLLLRPLGTGLLDDRPIPLAMMAFVLLLLATVLYDGLIGTGEWAILENALRSMLPGGSEHAAILIRTAGLLLLCMVFFGAYVGISGIMSALAGGKPRPLEVARSFALSLVPIAIGYHVAHYAVFLLIQGQYLIPLLSDPFGYGWNLFGTAGYRVDIGLVGARFTWYAALLAIVAGHVTAVYLAHVRAVALFDDRRAALRTQVPLTALMVVYTFVGLSIIAEPIAESRAAAETSARTSEAIAVPSNALVPSARGSFEPAGPDKSAKVKLTYKVLGSAFHDATKTTTSDLLYAYAFAYRWGTRTAVEGTVDSFVESATSPLRRHLVAVRIVSAETASRSFRVGDVNFVREVFTVEVYLAIAPDDPDWNAVVAPPWSAVPWHLLVLMEEAVARGWAAFSKAEAQRRGVEWLDLARSKELSAKLAGLAAEFERQGYRPDAVRNDVSAQDARQRWRAIAAFYKASGHFMVTNGPYKLKGWTPQSVTLEAFRDLTYPLGVGSYDAYAIPRRGFVTKADWNGERLTISGDIEVTEKFQRSYRLVRTSLQDVPAAVLKRSQPECRYLITDANGRAAATGVASLASDGSFQIDLKDRLPPGHYTLAALIAVNGNVVDPQIHRMPLISASRP